MATLNPDTYELKKNVTLFGHHIDYSEGDQQKKINEVVTFSC